VTLQIINIQFLYMYAPAFGNQDPQGFTNRFMEARNQSQFFGQGYQDYKLIHEEPGRENTIYRDLLKSRIARSALSDAFFGGKNIELLKVVICRQIYQMSGGLYKISPESQNTEPLVMVMMTLYLDYAKNAPDNISGQVIELNQRVIDYMVPHTISKIKEHLVYIRNHSQQPLTMDRPINISQAGTRSGDMSRLFI
jgi:hypothetical protein